MTPSSTLMRMAGPFGASAGASAIQQPIIVQTPVTTPSTRTVFPWNSAGLASRCAMGVASFTVGAAPKVSAPRVVTDIDEISTVVANRRQRVISTPFQPQDITVALSNPIPGGLLFSFPLSMKLVSSG